MKFTKFILITISVLLLLSLTVFGMTASPVDAARPPTKTPGPSPTPNPYVNLLTNPGFETGTLSGWSKSGTNNAVFVQAQNPRSGSYNLAFWNNPVSWNSKAFQTVTGLTAGSYTFSAWIENWGGGNGSENYIYAENCGGTKVTTPVPLSGYYFQVKLIVNVTNNSCTVGIASVAPAAKAVVADDFEFYRNVNGTPTPTPVPSQLVSTMYVGGDITYRRMTQNFGGRWADASGVEKDVLDVLAPKGFNIARIRVYNNPGTTVTYTDGNQYQLQPGWQDINDAIQNAQAAKARGMKIFITFHYADFWTNPGFNPRPQAWNQMTLTQHQQAIYDYTVSSMNALKNAGVTPDYVSIGNEINELFQGYDRNSKQVEYYSLLKKAYDGVKAVSPASKVVIHLSTPDYGLYDDWVNDAAAQGLNYDIFGVSAYPFWSDMTIQDMAYFMTWLSVKTGKPTMVVETGAPWTATTQDDGATTSVEEWGANYFGGDKLTWPTPSQTAQKQYMQAFFQAMWNTRRVEAVVYWDPIAIDLPGDPNGWVVGGDNAVEDTALFDYNNPHKATEGLDAFNTWVP